MGLKKFDIFRDNEILIYSNFMYTEMNIHLIISAIGLLIVMIASVMISIHIKNIRICKNKEKNI